MSQSNNQSKDARHEQDDAYSFASASSAAPSAAFAGFYAWLRNAALVSLSAIKSEQVKQACLKECLEKLVLASKSRGYDSWAVSSPAPVSVLSPKLVLSQDMSCQDMSHNLLLFMGQMVFVGWSPASIDGQGLTGQLYLGRRLDGVGSSAFEGVNLAESFELTLQGRFRGVKVPSFLLEHYFEQALSKLSKRACQALEAEKPGSQGSEYLESADFSILPMAA